MTDSLLVASQDIAATQPPSHDGGLGSWPLSLIGGTFPHRARDPFSEQRPPQSLQASLGSGLRQVQQLPWNAARRDRLVEDNGTGIDVYLCRARMAVEKLAQSQERALRSRQFQEETEWLAENKNRFSGQWIALQGRRLLAVGTTAREVFLKVANETAPPLVILVDREDPPFAGW